MKSKTSYFSFRGIPVVRVNWNTPSQLERTASQFGWNLHYNPTKDVFRMVYQGRYNIYYVIRDALYIVYILDGRMQLNMDIAEPDIELPTIR